MANSVYKNILQWASVIIAIGTIIFSAGILLGSVSTNTRDIKTITNDVIINREDIARLKQKQAVSDDRWERIEKWMSKIDRKLENQQ